MIQRSYSWARIRKNIIQNFKNTTEKEIIDSINASITDGEEITLPGLGVFFEILWKNSDTRQKEEIINILKKNLN